MEEAKYVVQELNNIFKTDYNMLSLDSMTRVEVLQIICNVLSYLEAMNNILVTEETIDQVILDILQTLSHIKYEPEGKKDAIEFRNGLAMVNRSVVHPLLFWLLSNQKQVKQRAYIARYVEKVEVPPEIQQDIQVSSLYAQYKETIQEFWKDFETFKIQRKSASECDVLQSDIKKMAQDTQNLSQLLQKQKEKVENIVNKETMLVSVKTYLQEANQNKKLESQLKQHSDSMKNIENDIRITRNSLNQKKYQKPINVDPIKQKEGELHINKILVDTQLPEEEKLIQNELDVCEHVAVEPEPQQKDLDKLIQGIDQLNTNIKQLIEKKMTVNSSGSDKLVPFRNQAMIISNKKQEISSTVVELKSEVDKVNKSIDEKKQVLHNLVGGEVLHGEELKDFIGKLRERSVVYKQFRARLHGMSRELAVLSRTYDILLLKDNNLEKVLNEKNKKETTSNYEPLDDLAEVKIKSKKLAQELDSQRSKASNFREELIELRTKLDSLNITSKAAKEEFEEATGFISIEVTQLDTDRENIEIEIKEKENMWNTVRMEVEKLEQTLLKLGEEIISSVENDNNPTMKDVLIDSLNVEHKREENLKISLSNIDRIQKENESQMEAIQKMILILSELIRASDLEK